MKRYGETNWLFLITVCFVMIAGSVPFGAYIHNYGILLLLSQLIIALPSIIYLYISRQKVSDVIGFKKLSFLNIVLLVLFSYCMSQVMTFINALSRLVAKDVTLGTMSTVADQNSFLISLFLIAVVPSVLEEGVYRGIFYQEYRKVNPFKAALLSAFLFGLMHGNLNQFSYAFCMGLVLAIVIEATDSILSTMIIHFIINGSSVVLLYVLPKLVEDYDLLLEASYKTLSMDFETVVVSYGVRAVLFGIVGVFLLKQIAQNCNRLDHVKRLFQRNISKDRNDKKDRLFTKPLFVAIAICIFSMIANEFL